MSQENVEAVRRQFEAFLAGDNATALSYPSGGCLDCAQDLEADRL